MSDHDGTDGKDVQLAKQLAKQQAVNTSGWIPQRIRVRALSTLRAFAGVFAHLEYVFDWFVCFRIYDAYLNASLLIVNACDDVPPVESPLDCFKVVETTVNNCGNPPGTQYTARQNDASTAVLVLLTLSLVIGTVDRLFIAYDIYAHGHRWAVLLQPAPGLGTWLRLTESIVDVCAGLLLVIQVPEFTLDQDISPCSFRPSTGGCRPSGDVCVAPANKLEDSDEIAFLLQMTAVFTASIAIHAMFNDYYSSSAANGPEVEEPAQPPEAVPLGEADTSSRTIPVLPDAASSPSSKSEGTSNTHNDSPTTDSGAKFVNITVAASLLTSVAFLVGALVTASKYSIEFVTDCGVTPEASCDYSMYIQDPDQLATCGTTNIGVGRGLIVFYTTTAVAILVSSLLLIEYFLRHRLPAKITLFLLPAERLNILYSLCMWPQVIGFVAAIADTRSEVTETGSSCYFDLSFGFCVPSVHRCGTERFQPAAHFIVGLVVVLTSTICSFGVFRWKYAPGAN